MHEYGGFDCSNDIRISKTVVYFLRSKISKNFHEHFHWKSYEIEMFCFLDQKFPTGVPMKFFENVEKNLELICFPRIFLKMF